VGELDLGATARACRSRQEKNVRPKLGPSGEADAAVSGNISRSEMVSAPAFGLMTGWVMEI
jgi:hypothetical protein